MTEPSRLASPTAAQLTPAVAGLIAFIVFAITLHPSIPGGDSGELIAAARAPGIAHPPGYPLYTMIGFLWTHMVAFGAVAWRMNLLSAVCGAAAVAVMSWTTARLTRSNTATVAAGLALGFSAPFWKYAVVAEVFAPNALLATIVVAAIVVVLGDCGVLSTRMRPAATRDRALRERKAPAPDQSSLGSPRDAAAATPARTSTAWPYVILAFLGALLISHHHTLILLVLPAAAIILLLFALPDRAWQRVAPGYRRPMLGMGARTGIVAAALAGLLPLLYLPLAALRDPFPAWGDPRTLGAFLQLLLRADYGTFRLDPLEAGHVADRSHVLLFLESIPRDFTIAGTVLMVLGGIVLWRRHRALAWMVAGFFALQLLFFTRVHFPATPVLFLGVVERFYILPGTVLALMLGVGVAAVLERFPKRPAFVAAAASLIVIAVVWPLAVHWRIADQRGNRLIEALGRDVLVSLPANAVLFVQGDVFHNSLAALTVTERVRPDVRVLDQELLTRAWYVAALARREPGLMPSFGAQGRYTGTPETGTLRWLDHLIARRPVAFIGLKDSTFAERYQVMPRGFVLLAYPRGSEPGVRAMVDTALVLFPRMDLDVAFRDYDPWSFEAESRWRFPEFAARTALLLCDPVTNDFTLATRPGITRLMEYIDCNRAAAQPDADLLRAGGLVRAVHPAVVDHARAREDLVRYLALGRSGPKADEARRVIEYLDRLPR